MALDLTPEQQAIFDRVVGIVTQNDELRQRFKNAVNELNKQPLADDLDYINYSDDSASVEFRAASDAIDSSVLNVEPNLEKIDSWLYSYIGREICRDFREN